MIILAQFGATAWKKIILNYCNDEEGIKIYVFDGIYNDVVVNSSLEIVMMVDGLIKRSVDRRIIYLPKMCDF